MNNKKKSKKVQKSEQAKEARLSKLFKETLYDTQDEFFDITDSEIESALYDFTKLNDEVAAKNLILYFNWCFEQRKEVNSAYLNQFTSHAFKRIVNDGLSPDTAFAFKAEKGRYQREDKYDRDLTFAASMILLMRSGEKYLDAYEYVVGAAFPDGGGERIVREAYSKYKNDLSHVDDELLKPIAEYLMTS